MKCLALLILLPSLEAQALRLMTYNLHAYHPYKEDSRYLQDRKTGILTPAPPHIFYFNWVELNRGSQNRNPLLSDRLKNDSPDLVFLQEVVSGGPSGPKTCAQFLHNNSAHDIALLWNSRVKVHSACRGNVGWVTQENTFKEHRVLRKHQNSFEVVHDYSSNPYPNGMVIEGTAFLVKEPFQLRKNQELRLPTGIEEGHVFFQVAELFQETSRMQLPNPDWHLVVNIHGSHKLQHFEMGLALRNWVAQYLKNHKLQHHYKGTIVGGDFNSLTDEASFKIWTWPFDSKSFEGDSLAQSLRDSNADETYKPWASIYPLEKAWERIQWGVSKLYRLWREGHSETWKEWVSSSIEDGRCKEGCKMQDRIDHFVGSPNLPVLSTGVIDADVTPYNALQKLSDHPAVWLDLSDESYLTPQRTGTGPSF